MRNKKNIKKKLNKKRPTIIEVEIQSEKVEELSESQIMPTAVPILPLESEKGPKIYLHDLSILPATVEPVPAPIEVDEPREIPEDLKHPLENTWSLWLNTNESKNWTKNQKELTSFGTVEDYWCLYHHTKLPSELKIGQDYAVFKHGISPMWEDSANKPGGRWIVLVDRGVADRVWLDVVLLMIGENFPDSEQICGAVVNNKQKSKVSVWTRNKDKAANMEVGKKLKELFRNNFKLQFSDHKNNAMLYYI